MKATNSRISKFVESEGRGKEAKEKEFGVAEFAKPSGSRPRLDSLEALDGNAMLRIFGKRSVEKQGEGKERHTRDG